MAPEWRRKGQILTPASFDQSLKCDIGAPFSVWKSATDLCLVGEQSDDSEASIVKVGLAVEKLLES